MQENWGQTTFTCNTVQVVYENSSLIEVYFLWFENVWEGL